MSELLTFVHLTDLHVGDPAVQDDHLYSDTSATLAAILAEVKSLVPQPKFIVASGDLTNRGDADSYAQLKRLLAEAELDMPVLFALGNHDRRDGFYPAMLERTENTGAPYDHAQVIHGIHVIVLDSSIPNKVGGGFEPGQLDWLKSELDQHADLPKLLVMHHAPSLDADPSMEWESLSIADTEHLRQAVAGKNVIGILSGHIHFDRVTQILVDQHGRVARDLDRSCDIFLKLRLTVHDFHRAATQHIGWTHEHGVTDAIGDRDRFFPAAGNAIGRLEHA